MNHPINEPAERELFEAWAFTKSWRNFTRDQETDEYVVADSHLERLWRGWLARARIAAQREALLQRLVDQALDRAAEITLLRAREAELVKALQFYADPKRYDGPNQKAEQGDPYTAGPYRIDVTRDNGAIARAALAPEAGR